MSTRPVGKPVRRRDIGGDRDEKGRVRSKRQHEHTACAGNARAHVPFAIGSGEAGILVDHIAFDELDHAGAAPARHAARFYGKTGVDEDLQGRLIGTDCERRLAPDEMDLERLCVGSWHGEWNFPITGRTVSAARGCADQSYKITRK